MSALMKRYGVPGIFLAMLAALLLVAVSSCTTKNTNLQQTPEQQPNLQAEQEVTLLSPLELLKSSSAAPGRFNPGTTSDSVASNRVYWNNFRPYDHNGTGELENHAYAAYAFDLEGYAGPYGLFTQWAGGFGDFNDLWIGLSDWDRNTWSWSQTEDGLIDNDAVEQHISANGDLLVVLVVGGITTHSLEWLRVGPDIFPTADIQTSDSIGFSPMTITLDASGSEDAEGEIEYAWDETGDGVFTEYGPSPEHSFTLSGTQTVRPAVRVRDSANNTAEAEVDQPIVVLLTPTMLLTMEEKLGSAFVYGGLGTLEAPYFLSEYVDGDAIFLDANSMPDGSGEVIDPATLNWELIGDPSEGVLSWMAPGELLIGEIRTSIIGAVAYDDEGNNTNVVYFLRGSPEGYEVVMCFVPSQTSGDYPLQVNFDHSMSYYTNQQDYWDEPGSSKWDFDGDGVSEHGTIFNWGDHGVHQASFVFHEPGNYTITARPVWYGEEPLFDEAYSREIVVTDGGGPKWHFNNIPLPDNLETNRLARWGPMDLIEIEGKPVVRALTDGEYVVDDQNFILRALDNLGTSWETSATILPDWGSRVSNLQIIGGFPAVLLQKIEREYELSYMIALDTSGTAWDAPVTIYDDGGHPDFPELADVNGSPAVTFEVGSYPNYDIFFAGYDGVTAPNGWFNVTLDSCDEFSFGSGLAIYQVGGKPAVVYQYADSGTEEDEVRFIRALDGLGQTWETPVTVSAGSISFGNQPSLTVVNGFPAVCYLAYLPYLSLEFSMATDPDGSQWVAPTTVGNVYSDYGDIDTWMFEFQNRPLIFTDEAVFMNGSDTIRMWAPEDVEATSWPGASPVFSTEFKTVDTAIIDGKPAVVMVRYQWDDDLEISVQELRFGILY